MNPFPYIVVNKQITHQESYPYPVDLSGLHLGIGVFETILITKSRPLLLDKHIDRLLNGGLFFNLHPTVHKKEIKTIIHELILKNQAVSAKLNLFLTCRTPGVSASDNTVLIATIKPISDSYLNQAVSLKIQIPLTPRSSLNQYKLMAYGPTLYEKERAKPYDDALLITRSKTLLESTTSSLFLIKNMTLFTPKSSRILPGITRNFLMKVLSGQFEVKHTHLSLSDLEQADELFLTSSLRGVIPVSAVSNYANLCSGPITKQIQQRYHTEIAALSHRNSSATG